LKVEESIVRNNAQVRHKKLEKMMRKIGNWKDRHKLTSSASTEKRPSGKKKAIERTSKAKKGKRAYSKKT